MLLRLCCPLLPPAASAAPIVIAVIIPAVAVVGIAWGLWYANRRRHLNRAMHELLTGGSNGDAASNGSGAGGASGGSRDGSGGGAGSGDRGPTARGVSQLLIRW